MEDRQVSLKQVLDTVDEMPVMKDNNGMEFIEKSLVKTRIGMLQPELNEWCTDCKEYDQERHCCPRFNKVIRETVEEYKARHPEPCEDAVSRSDLSSEFEHEIHAMFDHIWDCEIEHPMFQDTVGELMEAVLQCHRRIGKKVVNDG